MQAAVRNQQYQHHIERAIRCRQPGPDMHISIQRRHCACHVCMQLRHILLFSPMVKAEVSTRKIMVVSRECPET
eukprot:5390104-Karenia_brevis.AAC.1